MGARLYGHLNSSLGAHISELKPDETAESVYSHQGYRVPRTGCASWQDLLLLMLVLAAAPTLYSNQKWAQLYDPGQYSCPPACASQLMICPRCYDAGAGTERRHGAWR